MINEDEFEITNKDNGVVVGKLPAPHKSLRYTKATELVMLADGLDNFLNYLEKHMPKPLGYYKSSLEQGSGGDFHAFSSYKESMDIFRNSPQKVVDFNPAELRIKDNDESGSTVDYNVTGDYIDMGRFMEGIPESWGSMHAGHARNRRVNIMVNLSQVWSTSHKDITHRSERILRLVDALEAGGIRAQIIGVSSDQCSHVEITLKRHEEPLTITDLAVVNHPEFLRRQLFRVIEFSKTADDGYGHSYVFDDTISERPEMMQSDNNDEMNIFIGGSMQGIKSIDDKFDKLEKLLVWEMSKPVPEVDAVKIDKRGIYFNPNGARASAEIKREGVEAINAD